MEDAKLTAEEIKRALAADFEALAEEVAQAMNQAQAGRIIADSEEPVRDATAEFRQRMFEKALGLLQNKQEAFSPSGQRPAEQGASARHAPDRKRTRRRK
jgi:hypothetical protein